MYICDVENPIHDLSGLVRSWAAFLNMQLTPEQRWELKRRSEGKQMVKVSISKKSGKKQVNLDLTCGQLMGFRAKRENFIHDCSVVELCFLCLQGLSCTT